MPILFLISDSSSKKLESVGSFNDCFAKLEDLGKGRFGTVCKVKEYRTGNVFAGKFVKCIKQQDKTKVGIVYKVENAFTI